VENRYRFQGREYDAHRGDYYFRNRTYIPEWGVFTGPDALVQIEANGPCNYLFANNNPLRYRDPEGLLTVYIWNSGKNCFRTETCSVGPFGHASIKLEDETYISLWPAMAHRGGIFGGRDTYIEAKEHTYDRDVKEEGRAPDHEIRILWLDEVAMKAWWRKFKNHPNRKFQPFYSNCSTIAIQVLKEGGGDKWIPFHSQVDWTVLGIWTPGDVRDYARVIRARQRAAMAVRDAEARVEIEREQRIRDYAESCTRGSYLEFRGNQITR